MLYLLSFIIFILCGILSWNWIEPDSFGQGIVFVIVWFVLTSLGYWILEIIYRNTHKF